MPVLLIVLIVAFEYAAVRPNIFAVAVQHAVLEIALEVAAVVPLEHPHASHLVFMPRASVYATIGPDVAPYPLLDAMNQVAVVVAAIAPDLNA